MEKQKRIPRAARICAGKGHWEKSKADQEFGSVLEDGEC
jgi:hypothetical protein